MEFIHHTLDVYPNPREKKPLYINEAWMIDDTLPVTPEQTTPPEEEPDNIRMYIPLDVNKKSVLRRLEAIIQEYGAATERNEFCYEIEVERLFMQVEVYDQMWYARQMPSDWQTQKHSAEGIALAKAFVDRLERIIDIDSEKFPFRMIREIKEEFFGIED